MPAPQAAAPQLRQTASQPLPSKPTKKQIERFLECDDTRRLKGREARALKGEQDAIEPALEAYALHAGGKERRVRVCGYELAIETVAVAGRLDYKAELVKRWAPSESPRWRSRRRP